MTSKVRVNGLAITHKGCGGVSAATIPDVCKTPTPAGLVPIPYPNVAYASDLEDGTATVFVDGYSVAIMGSKYARSTGDEPGTAGGVGSGTFAKEARWLLCSLDVRKEGAGVCRLADPLTHNHGNTVNMGGELHDDFPPGVAKKIAVICTFICECNAKPYVGVEGQKLKQQCVSDGLQKLDDAQQNRGKIKPEINYDMTQEPPAPIMSRKNGLRGTDYLPKRTEEIPDFVPGTGMVRRPDAVIVDKVSKPPTQDNLEAVVEIKFPPDDMDERRKRDYERIAGDPSKLIKLTPKECGCEEPERKPEPVAVPKKEQAKEKNRETRLKPTPVEVALLALTLAVLVADDIIGGEADDVLIPGLVGRLAMAF